MRKKEKKKEKNEIINRFLFVCSTIQSTGECIKLSMQVFYGAVIYFESNEPN